MRTQVLVLLPNLIETMKIAFPFLLIDHPRLLQEVIGHVSTYRVSLEVKVDVHVLLEA